MLRQKKKKQETRRKTVVWKHGSSRAYQTVINGGKHNT